MIRRTGLIMDPSSPYELYDFGMLNIFDSLSLFIGITCISRPYELCLSVVPLTISEVRRDTLKVK